MKPSKLLFMLTALLFVLFIAPINGEVIVYDYDRVEDELDDHPWGGDEPDPGGGGITNRIIPWNTPNIGASYFIIDVIKIVYTSYFDDAGINEKNLLPGEFETSEKDQKGQ